MRKLLPWHHARRVGVVAVVLGVVVLSNARQQPAAQALTVMWDGGGGDGKWSTAANCEGDALPGAGSDVVIRGAGIVHVDVDVTVSSLQFGTTDRSLASFGDDTLLIDVGRTLTIRDVTGPDYLVRTTLAEDVVLGGRLVLDPVGVRRFLCAAQQSADDESRPGWTNLRDQVRAC